jgi:hypothetical protein
LVQKWCYRVALNIKADGHLAKMSSHVGMNYSQMLELILNAAELRHNPVTEIPSL